MFTDYQAILDLAPRTLGGSYWSQPCSDVLLILGFKMMKNCILITCMGYVKSALSTRTWFRWPIHSLIAQDISLPLVAWWKLGNDPKQASKVLRQIKIQLRFCVLMFLTIEAPYQLMQVLCKNWGSSCFLISFIIEPFLASVTQFKVSMLACQAWIYM